MGDHDTWYTLLPFWHDLEHSFEEGLRRDWKFLMFQDTHFTMVHVVGALIAALIILVATFRYRSYAASAESKNGLIPSRRFTLAAMMDGFVGAVYRLSVDVMGEKDAKRFLPLTGTLGLFIFCCNLQGLIPGLLPPTDTLKTNLALSLFVFVVYNAMGLYRNGMSYLAHFLGPKLGGFPWLFPIFLPVEIASHLGRPVSLSLRLMGNILADHKVVLAIAGLIAVLAPVPFLLLGVLVVIVQTLIFTLLTIIYIGSAIEHLEGH
ncbi:F0F1 ATP synthase subunit A [Paraliomyxa miuraensis]|uniref:F0F1 ATP synthase subunit A n=1 Tax=Paraliomyxa miuraensis TaxID=376150 RepID=UPI00225BFA6B|nr:F0F1 ATP synthase subunit A [Paraliomyxa miuraensis]MCX4240358.1 F0F1 ATP synthase subunit A [Paraliomyxa miuraensis]